MKVKFVNVVNNISKFVEFDYKEIAKKYLEENKENTQDVIDDLNFGGYYDEDLSLYIESLLDKTTTNGLGAHSKYYSYDIDECMKLKDIVKNYIIQQN